MLDGLSAENWDEFHPAARRIALADLRRNDAAAARALLEAKAATESAEVRLPLIELMRVNLSPADAPYLQSLSNDRSGKVKQLAARLLARIGQVLSDESDEQIEELADFIEQGRSGLLRRHTVYTPKPLKNAAQIKRRQELFESCQLGELAAKLGCNELDLVQSWQLGGKDGVDASFAGMVGESGGDTAVAKLAERLLGAGDAAAFALLLPRLDRPASKAFATMVLAKGQIATHLLYVAPDIEAGNFSAQELMSSNAYQQMRAEVANRTTSVPAPDFSIYGYLATAAAAEKIVVDLTAAGLASADPSLALLRLNSALATR